MIKKIPTEPYKKHQGEGGQLSYKGMALTPAVQAVIVKVNELIDMANDFLEMKDVIGVPAPAIGCCTEEKDHDEGTGEHDKEFNNADEAVKHLLDKVDHD